MDNHVYEMLLTLVWLLKNRFHYPHQSIQDVKGLMQSGGASHSHAPLPRVPLPPSKEGGGLEGSSIALLTVISFHQVDMLPPKGGA